MGNLLSQGWDDLIGRVGGPMSFRLIIQPAVAAFLAIRAGLKDARECRPVFFWTMLLDPAQRLYLLRQGWKDVGKVFIVAIVLDAIYQAIVLGWIYPGQTLIVATTLALVPYLMVRGMTNRLATLALTRQPPEGKK